MSWSYKQPDHPESEEVAKENNGLRWRISMTATVPCWRRPAAEQLRAAAR
jgi:hypothetical protein